MVILNTNDLIEQLHASGFLAQKKEARAELLCTLNHYQLPTYLNIIMAVGAFLGTFFFYHLLTSLYILNQNSIVHLLGWGFGFIVAALLIYQSLKSAKTPLMQSAAVQTSLIFMWLGKILVVKGIAKLIPFIQILQSLDTDERLFVGMAVITVLTYFIYNLNLDRFVSTFLTLLLLIYNLYSDGNAIGIFVLFTALLVVTGTLFIVDRKSRTLDPFEYACCFALCVCTALVTMKPEFQTIPLLVYDLLLTFAMIALIYLILTPLIHQRAFILCIIGIMVLAFFSSPLILLSLSLLLLGYWKHDRLITPFAILFFIASLAQYFYALPVSINQKTMILVASGLLLFVVSYIVLRLDLNGGDNA